MALTPSAQLGQHDRRAPARRTLNFAAASFGCAPCLSLDPGGSRGFRRLRAALRRADKTLRKMKRCEERSATAPPPAPGGHSGASGSTATCEGGGNAGSGARTRASVSTGGTSRHSPSGGDERRVDIGERSPASTISGSRDGRPGVLPPQAKALARPALHPRNAVKTQAVSCTRKLDLSSRSEAIERAGEVGLGAPRLLTWARRSP
jgi:hypothetical protein